MLNLKNPFLPDGKNGFFIFSINMYLILIWSFSYSYSVKQSDAVSHRTNRHTDESRYPESLSHLITCQARND